LISISGIGKDTFDVANRLFKGIRGGLGISTTFLPVPFHTR
jgi:TRAP-type C4-dicarboxylate transport system permease large subunit